MSEIKIGIIIPCYYSSKVLDRCLNSINKQTKREQCIVYLINDCSPNTDCDYQDVIKKYNTLTIIYLKNQKRSGPGVARQLGINQCKEDYILFVDDDDYLYDKYVIEKLLIYAHNNYNIISMNRLWINKKNNQLIKDHLEINALNVVGDMFKRTFLQQYNIYFDTECPFVFEDTFVIDQLNYYLSHNQIKYIKIPDALYVVFHSNDMKTLTWLGDDYNFSTLFFPEQIIYSANVLLFYEKHRKELTKEDKDFIIKILSNFYSGNNLILLYLEKYGYNPSLKNLLYSKWLYIINLIDKNKSVLYKTDYFNNLKEFLTDKIFSMDISFENFKATFKNRFDNIKP